MTLSGRVSQSIFAHEFGETGLLFAPKLTNLYRTPGMSTFTWSAIPSGGVELHVPYAADRDVSAPVRIADYSQVVVPGFRYKYVDLSPKQALHHKICGQK